MNGLRDDLAGVSEPGGFVPQADDGWAEQFAGQEAAGEDPAKISGQTVPSFGFYGVHFFTGKGGFTKQKKSPTVRIGATITAGPAGTVDTIVWDDLYLLVSKTKTEKVGDQLVESPKDATDFADDVEARNKKLNKLARVGKFGQAAPANASKTALDAYAAQFEGINKAGFDGVVEIRESTEEYQGVSRTRNRIILESLRAPDEPATKAGQKKGFKTAADEMLAMIEAADATAARKAGKGDGRTAGSVVRKAGLGD